MLLTQTIPARDGSTSRLLLVLHGLGDSAAGWEFFPDELKLPWLTTLLVNAPDPYYSGYAWYDFFGDQAAGIVRSRRLLFELLDALVAKGHAPEQIALLGFSQGCVMTLDAGLRYPRRLGALVGLSGYVFDPPSLLADLSPAAREQRILITHGTMDPLLPIEASRTGVQQLTQAGLRIQWEEFPKAHTLDVFRELRLVREFLSAAFHPTRHGGRPT